MEREEPRVGELAAEALAATGVTIHTGRTVTRAQPAAGGTLLTLSDGSQVETDVVILGSGRTPRTAGFGLETTGVELTGRGGIAVDKQCQAGPGLWAVGDVTGVALFTHLAKYQGRVVADNILGRDHPASYEGIPRVVFGDPEIAAVGLTATAAAEISVADSADRSWTYERDPRGVAGLLADRDRRVLVGAWAVAPLAGEWIHYAALAIRAQIPIDTLLDQVAQYPTYTEAWLAALEQLSL